MTSGIPSGCARWIRRATDVRSLKRWLFVAMLLGIAPFARGDDFTYVVRPGDNPWNLTERYLLDLSYWPKLRAFNRITEPTRIKPGTVLHIPAEWLRLVASEVRVAAWSGDVSCSAADGAPVELLSGAVLGSGASLRTGSDASVTLEFDDGSRVLMLADGELRITQAARLGKDGTVVQLQLVRGNLENLVTPRGDRPGRFEITTPAAVAAVRGTEFRLGASSQQTRNEVLVGGVDLGNASGRREVLQGYGSRAPADGAPSEPVPLLAAPDLAGAPHVVERMPFEATIAPLPGAVAYRTLLGSDATFAAVVSNHRVDLPTLAIDDVPDGDYVVRVRGIDPDGLEGIAATRPITIHARPEPPFLIEPGSDAQVATDRPTLRWTSAAATFGMPLVDDDSIDATTLASPASLPPGSYFWRLASVDATKGPGPFSDPQTFRIVLPGPDVEPPVPDGDRLALRWRDMGTGVGYRLQLARDPAFGDMLVDAKVDVPAYPLSKPAPGTYYLRVASISPDGATGPWGSLQTFAVAEQPSQWRLLFFLVPLLLL
jgi:hypothetical protein